MGKSNAERQRDYIARLKAKAAASGAESEVVARLKARIAELEAAASKRSTFDVTALRRQIDGLKLELTFAKQQQDASTETIALRREVASLQRKLTAFAKSKPPRPSLPPNEEVAALRKTVAGLRRQLREVCASPRGAVFMAAADRRAVLRCLHPDTEADPARKERLTQAFQIFSALPLKEIEA